MELSFLYSSDSLHVFGAILLTNILAYIFYRSFELKWPELYFSINDRTALFLSVSPVRYIAFRFLPLLVITVFSVGVVLKGVDKSFFIRTSVSATLIHAFLSNGLAIRDLVTNSEKIKRYFNSLTQFWYHIFTILTLTFIGYIAGKMLLVNSVSQYLLLPSIEGLTDNIWSAVLTVVFMTFLQQLTNSGSLSNEDNVFKKSMESIPGAVFEEIDLKSKKYNADPILIKAICIAENIQRPKWFRFFENVFARLKVQGTYGIMQVKSNKYISDIESVEIAIERHFRNTSGITQDQAKDYIKKYNSNLNYMDVVIKAMIFLY